jgi:hypothetical protein
VHDGNVIRFYYQLTFEEKKMLRRPPVLPRSVNDRLNRLATSFFTTNDGNDLKRGNQFQAKQSRIEIDYSSLLFYLS